VLLLGQGNKECCRPRPRSPRAQFGSLLDGLTGRRVLFFFSSLFWSLIEASAATPGTSFHDAQSVTSVRFVAPCTLSLIWIRGCGDDHSSEHHNNLLYHPTSTMLDDHRRRFKRMVEPLE